MGDSAFQKLVDTMSEVGGSEVPAMSEIIFGTVVSVNPLSIKLQNKGTLPVEFFILSQMVRKYEIEIVHDHRNPTTNTGYGPDPHDHTQPNTRNKTIRLTIFEDLKKGEVVRLISLNNGQKYFVIDREDNGLKFEAYDT